jgi:hypothetical protein
LPIDGNRVKASLGLLKVNASKPGVALEALYLAASFPTSQSLTNGRPDYVELPCCFSLPCDWLIGSSRALDCSIWEPGITIMGRAEGLGMPRGTFAARTAARPTALFELGDTGETRVCNHLICSFPKDLSQRINIVSTFVHWIKSAKTQSAGALSADPGFEQGSSRARRRVVGYPSLSPSTLLQRVQAFEDHFQGSCRPGARIAWRAGLSSRCKK